MQTDFGSRQVRFLLAASGICCAIALSQALDSAKSCVGNPFGDTLRCSTDAGSFVGAFLGYTVPVWGFWLATWVFKWRLPFTRQK